MAVNIAINGFGRIGRCVLRALEKRGAKRVRIVAINDLCPLDLSAHLLKWDTTHGAFPRKVSPSRTGIKIGTRKIPYFSERDPGSLPWGRLGVDVVMECTGVFVERDSAALHLRAGARKVLVSAPAKNADATIAYGVNHESLRPHHKVVSNASCTTNCLAPVAKVLHDKFGIVSGLMSTVHAYTNDQMTLDAPHKDFRRARAAAESIIPTKTGAASAIGLVIPALKGKLSGIALRVPVRNVSLVDLTFVTKRSTDAAQINMHMSAAANGALKGVLEVCAEPLVSSDFNGNSASSIVDASETMVDASGKLGKVLSWYDNEWGFANRMIDTAEKLAATN